jgi:acyl-coenzyme A thioesterase 13
MVVDVLLLYLSLAISTMGYPPPTGVSVNISTEFVRPGGKVGDELISVGEVVKIRTRSRC